MTDTDISMVAKTVGPGPSPPSTTAGSTGDTVLNETAFDVTEIRETVNPVGPEAGQSHAHIGSMNSDELVNLLESHGADGGFLESVLSGGVTGAEFKEMLGSVGSAPEAVQHFSGFTGMESFNVMVLWSRIRTETNSGQTLGTKPRLTQEGPRATAPTDHAVNREEDELEGRSMDSEESRPRTRAGTCGSAGLNMHFI